MGLSDLLQYNTVKVVTIKDKCLGSLHYTFMFLIFLYVLIYKIIGQTGYVLFEEPVGTVRMQLQGPTVDHCDPDYPVPSCDFAFSNVSTLPYCAQSGQTHYNGFKTLPCRNLDSYQVVYPVTGGTPFYIATQVTMSNMTRVCSEPAPGTYCKKTYEYACHHSFDYDPNCPKDDWARDSFYVADIEKYTVLIDHSVRSPTVQKLQADSVAMNGYLEGCNGEKIIPAQTSEKQDIFTVGQLLANMQNVEDSTSGNCGLSLDEQSSVLLSKNSVRKDGLIMIIIIDYNNVHDWTGPSDTIEYVYRVEFIRGTKSKIAREQYVHYPDQRVTEDRHGIKIVVLQTGKLGAYDTTTLLLQLTTSLTLLAVATTIVDMLATRVLKNRTQYRHVKFEEFVHQKDGSLLMSPSQTDLHASSGAGASLAKDGGGGYGTLNGGRRRSASIEASPTATRA